MKYNVATMEGGDHFANRPRIENMLLNIENIFCMKNALTNIL